MTDSHELMKAENVEMTAPDPKKGEVTLHPMVQAMMERQDFGPDELAKLMEMQVGHEKREAEKEFTAARSMLIKDLPRAIVNNKKGHQARYATLPHIMRKVMPALEKHGFIPSWTNGKDGRDEIVTCVLTHRGGHAETNTRQSLADRKNGLSSVQADQACVTYLKRQTILSILGLSTDDEPDADEPAPVRQDVNRIDDDRNQAALETFNNMGYKDHEVEAIAGKPLHEWRAQELAKLREHLRSEKTKASKPEPEIIDAEIVGEEFDLPD